MGIRRGKLNASVLAMMVKFMMEEETFTYQELEDLLGVHRHTLFAYIAAFRRNKLLHLHDKLRDTNNRRTVWQFEWGRGKDFCITAQERKQANNDNRRQARIGKSRRVTGNPVFGNITSMAVE